MRICVIASHTNDYNVKILYHQFFVEKFWFYLSKNVNNKIISRILSRGDCHLQSHRWRLTNATVGHCCRFKREAKAIYAQVHWFYFDCIFHATFQTMLNISSWNPIKVKCESRAGKYWYIWLFEWKMRLFCVHVLCTVFGNVRVCCCMDDIKLHLINHSRALLV